MKNFKTKIIISIIAAAIIYMGFSLYVDFEKLVEAFILFKWEWFPLILLLSLVNYYLRFERWQYYLDKLNLKVKRGVSFIIFFAGLIMSITPGKFGEVLKSYLIKEHQDIAIHRTAPIILVERLVDFIGLLIVAMIGAIIFDFEKNLVLITLVFFFAALVLLSWRTMSIKILNLISKIRFLQKFSGKILEAYDNSYQLIKPFPLFSMLLLTMAAWGMEGFGLYLILYSFNTDVTVFWAIFIYSFSTIFGALTLMPGGLGSTEGSLTYLLHSRTGIPLNISFVATFLVRIATLWFAIFLGIAALVYFQKKIAHKKVFELEEN